MPLPVFAICLLIETVVLCLRWRQIATKTAPAIEIVAAMWMATLLTVTLTFAVWPSSIAIEALMLAFLALANESARATFTFAVHRMRNRPPRNASND